MISVYFQGEPFNITVIQIVILKKLKSKGSRKTYRTLLELTPPKKMSFSLERSEETSGVNRKIWPQYKEQRLIEFCQENALVITNSLFLQHN